MPLLIHMQILAFVQNGISSYFSPHKLVITVVTKTTHKQRANLHLWINPNQNAKSRMETNRILPQKKQKWLHPDLCQTSIWAVLAVRFYESPCTDLKPTSHLCVSVWGCAIGRTGTIGADSGEPRRGLIAAPMSVLEIRCQKFPGGLQTPAPNLPSSPSSFSHPSTPHSLLFLPFSSSFHSSSEQRWDPFDFDSSLLITEVPIRPSIRARVCLQCEKWDFPTATRDEQGMHAHSDKLIDE